MEAVLVSSHLVAFTHACVQAPGGCEAAQAELHNSSSISGRAAALAFLATSAKEHGAVREAIELLQAAAELEPTHAGVARPARPGCCHGVRKAMPPCLPCCCQVYSVLPCCGCRSLSS